MKNIQFCVKSVCKPTMLDFFTKLFTFLNHFYLLLLTRWISFKTRKRKCYSLQLCFAILIMKVYAFVFVCNDIRTHCQHAKLVQFIFVATASNTNTGLLSPSTPQVHRASNTQSFSSCLWLCISKAMRLAGRHGF